ncbi:MAG: mannosyltransferase [Blastocatellia bacterium]|jgi:uncharacterized membrane protein|nr:mannosyltransferase [Blastocatellia bacterium]
MSLDKEPQQSLTTNHAPEDALSHRTIVFLFSLVLALFVAIRLRGLTASCLWFDEIFSVHAARHPWSQIFSFVAADIIHPPLFYILLKVWIVIGGESLMWLRLFPALASIAAIVPFILLGRELRLKAGERNLALALLAVNGFLIKYAQEVRMYSLLFFLAVCSLWLFVRFITGGNAKRRALALFAVNLLLVYTHYSGWVVVGLQFLVLLLWRHRRSPLFAASIAALLAAYAPWIYEVSKAAPANGLAQNIGWVTRPGVRDIVEAVTVLNKPLSFSQSSADALYDPVNTTLIILLLILPLMVLAWQLFRKNPKVEAGRVDGMRAFFLFAFAPAFIFFLMSWALPHSIWGTRHLIIAAVPYSILTAIALRRLRPYWLKIFVYTLLGCWFLLAGMFALLRPAPNFIWCAWEPLAQEVAMTEAQPSPAVHVYAFEDLVAYHLWHGLDATGNSGFKVSVIKNAPGMVEDPAYFLPREFSDIAVLNESMPQDDSFWIAFRATQWDEMRAPLNFFLNKGYRLGPVLRRRAQGQEAFLVRLHRE